MFCVYLTTYLGNKMPPFYIGHTSIKKIESGYRGSPTSKKYSTIFRNELRDNPSLFSTKIISEVANRKMAIIRERDIQLKLNVVGNSLYVNQSVAQKAYRQGWKPDNSQRIRMSNIHKNIQHTSEWNKNVSEAKKGKPRDPKTADILRSMNKGKRWFNDGVKSYLKHPSEALPDWKTGHLFGAKGSEKQKGKPKHTEEQKAKWSEIRKGKSWRYIHS